MAASAASASGSVLTAQSEVTRQTAHASFLQTSAGSLPIESYRWEDLSSLRRTASQLPDGSLSGMGEDLPGIVSMRINSLGMTCRMASLCPTSLPAQGVGSSIGPSAYPNHKHGHTVWSVIVCENGRSGQICTPCRSLRGWQEEHQMRMPAAVTIAQPALFGHHVAHRARFERRQFLFFECGCNGFEHLSFRLSGQR